MEGRMSLIKEAEDLFGNMRDTTPEEQKNINSHLKEISMPTGMNIFDLLDKENEIVDCHYCGHAMCKDENDKVSCYVDDFEYFDHHVEDSSEAQNCSWFYFCDTFPKC